MKKSFLFLSLIVLIGSHISSQTPGDKSFVPGQVIVQSKTAISIDKLHIFGVNRIAQICKDKQGKSNLFVLYFTDTLNIQEKIRQLINSGFFNWVEPNGYMQACIVPDDTLFPRQYGCHNTGTFNLTFSTIDSDSDLPEAWDIEQGDTNVVVAILDGGIALAHPEFTGRIWNNYEEIPNNGIDDDGNGFIDDNQGWNFAYGTNVPEDDLGHGTSVTGILGANGNNNIGMAGIDWNCKLMICKVLDNTNFGTYDNIANAIYYAVNNSANVINMSFAGGYSSLLATAIQYAWDNNVVMCAATGNSNISTPQYPSSDSLVLAVGGSNAWDVRYIYSNYGPHMDVVAAGDYIYVLDYKNFNNYNDVSAGTSLSSPFVAGIASLLKAQKYTRTNQEIYDIIRNTAEDQVDHYTGEDTPGWDMFFGFGRVNAYKALLYDTIITQVGVLSHTIPVKVYPNPVSTVLHFYLDGNSDIKVIDLLGEVVMHKFFSGYPKGNVALDVSTLSSGFYFIQIGNRIERFVKE